MAFELQQLVVNVYGWVRKYSLLNTMLVFTEVHFIAFHQHTPSLTIANHLLFLFLSSLPHLFTKKFILFTDLHIYLGKFLSKNKKL